MFNTTVAVTNGIRECNAENCVRVSVELSTKNPPHTHSTISFPIYGIADTRFVITVPPRNDICPHGRTFPIRAAAVVKNRITAPTAQVCIKLYDP